MFLLLVLILNFPLSLSILPIPTVDWCYIISLLLPPVTWPSLKKGTTSDGSTCVVHGLILVISCLAVVCDGSNQSVQFVVVFLYVHMLAESSQSLMVFVAGVKTCCTHADSFCPFIRLWRGHVGHT